MPPPIDLADQVDPMEMSTLSARSMLASPATVFPHPERQDPKRLVMIARPSPELRDKARVPTTGTEPHVLRDEATGLIQRALDPDPKAAKDLQERHKPMAHSTHQDFTTKTISPEKMPTWAHTMA
jgi:hypothetical protein